MIGSHLPKKIKSLPDGGTEGQILTKTSTGEAWLDKPTYDDIRETAISAQNKADSAYGLAETKQDAITGTAGDFVVIDSDGNVTTKTVPYAEEASF